MEALREDIVKEIDALTIREADKKALTSSLQVNKMDQLLRRMLSSKKQAPFFLAEKICSRILEINPHECMTCLENVNKDGNSALRLLVDGRSSFVKKYFLSKDCTNLGINAGVSLFDDSVRCLIRHCFRTYIFPMIKNNGDFFDQVNKGRYMLELGAGDGRFYRLLMGDVALEPMAHRLIAVEQDKGYFDKLKTQLPKDHAFNIAAVEFLTYKHSQLDACPIIWSWNFIDLFQGEYLLELMHAVLNYLPENGIWLCIQEYSNNNRLIQYILRKKKFRDLCPIFCIDESDATINFYEASVLDNFEIRDFLKTRYQLPSIENLEDYRKQIISLMDISWFSKVVLNGDSLINGLLTVRQLQLKRAMIEEVIEPLVDKQRRVTFLNQQSFFRVVDLDIVSVPSTCSMNDDLGFKYFPPDNGEAVVNRGLFVFKKENSEVALNEQWLANNLAQCQI